jgi:hypothetical protein
LAAEVGDGALEFLEARVLLLADGDGCQQPEGGGKSPKVTGGEHEREEENRLLFADTAVTAENPGGGEFTEFVADHILGHIDRDEGFAIVDGEVVADEVRGDHGLAAPRFDGLAVGSGGGNSVDFGEQLLIDERAFLE